MVTKHTASSIGCLDLITPPVSQYGVCTFVTGYNFTLHVTKIYNSCRSGIFTLPTLFLGRKQMSSLAELCVGDEGTCDGAGAYCVPGRGLIKAVHSRSVLIQEEI